MMQLTTITSFLVLFCNLFGTIAPINDDLIELTNYDTLTSKNVESCVFGVKSVTMILFTSDVSQGQTLDGENNFCNLFDTSKPIFIMTHGFIANASNYYFPEFASLLIKKNYTVISLDWSDAACYNDPNVMRLLEYPFAVGNTHKVGMHLASYIKLIINDCHVPLKNITVMGHSLGAHISSFALKNLQKSGYGTVKRFIGTDPAAPLFMLENCENRFCNKDAKYVIALHTSILGIQQSIGDLDLWFNNGFSQPACGILGLANCSHNIVIEYLAHTLLDDCGYVGVPISRKMLPVPNLLPGCSNKNNCIVVDNRIFNDNYAKMGDYCVSVSSEYPYCTKNDLSDCSKNSKNKLLPILPF